MARPYPVWVGMVSEPADWAWSSCNATVGRARVPSRLTVDGLLRQFAERRPLARRRYRRFVGDGIGQGSIWGDLNFQIYLGDERLVERIQTQAAPSAGDVNIPKVPRRRPVAPLTQIEADHGSPVEAMAAAYATGAYSY